ncbi:MAG: biotin--[Lachnospiraceae bacterium]|nr:biotin--[acetyl-CoA-carboxylase] ligase [Lachnospiraceae bacterium]
MRLEIVEQIDSTNDELYRRGLKGEEEQILIAKEQTNGHGRLGRKWESEEGVGLYMSILLRPDFEPDKAPLLSLITGLAIKDAIEEVTNLSPKIKWPNDLVLNKKKVAGILTTSNIESEKLKFSVVGLGVNMFQKLFPEELQDKATSLLMEGACFSAETLSKSIAETIESYYNKFLKEKSFEGFIKEYEAALINKDERVKIIDGNNTYEAVALGVAKDGALKIKKDDGTIENIKCGEVSVRGLYTYV